MRLMYICALCESNVAQTTISSETTAASRKVGDLSIPSGLRKTESSGAFAHATALLSLTLLKESIE